MAKSILVPVEVQQARPGTMDEQSSNIIVATFADAEERLLSSGRVLTRDVSIRLLEVPVWMFDRTLSARWLAMPIAYADFACLLALAKLLEEVGTPSQGADRLAFDPPVCGS